METTFNPINSSNQEKLPVIYTVLRKIEKRDVKRIVLVESQFHQTKYWQSAHFYKPISQMIPMTDEG
ncbi:MAG: hypothetical protein ACK5RG_13320 [Cyclobacteriaceae bacterium]|jgi:hypothetical protein